MQVIFIFNYLIINLICLFNISFLTLMFSYLVICFIAYLILDNGQTNTGISRLYQL